MKISKTDIGFLLKNILIWTLLNFAFNLLGLWISKLIYAAGFNSLESVSNEFVKPILLQSLLFAVCFATAYILLKNKKLSYYIFTLIQFVLFHLIFFFNIKLNNGLHFETTIGNWGLKYLSYQGQYLVDILYLYFPIDGNFENGMFIPLNTGLFYIHWVLLVLLYFAVLTWISKVASKFFFNKKEKNGKINS